MKIEHLDESQSNHLIDKSDMIRKAKDHLRASLNYKSKNINLIDSITCECCGLPLVSFIKDNKPIKLFGRLDDLKDLGVVYYFYFKVVIYLMIIILVAGAGITIPSVVYNILTSNGLGSGFKGFLISASWKYKQTPMWVNYIYGGIMMQFCCSFMYCKHHLYRSQLKKNLTENPSNFTVLIKNIPEDTDFESLKNVIENEFRVEEVAGSVQENQPLMVNVVDVCYGFDIDKFVEKCLELYRSKNNTEDSMKEKFEKLVNDYNNENPQFQKNGFVLLTLNTIKQKAKVKSHFKLKTKDSIIRKLTRNLFCQVCVKPRNPLEKNYIRVRSAPDPDDIIWHKLSGTLQQRFCKKLVTYSCAFSLIVIANLIVYLIEALNKDSDEFIISGIAISFIIIIFNNAISSILKTLTQKEYHFSFTLMTISLMRKTFIFTSINTVLSMYIVFASDITSKRLLHNNSNIQIILTIWLLMEALINPLFSFFSPLYLKKLHQRAQLIKNNIHKEQNEINHIYTNPRFNIAGESAKYLRIVFIVAAFSPLNPLGLFIAFIPILAFYFTDKYLLLRRCSRSSRLSEKFNHQVLNVIKSYFPILLVIFTQILFIINFFWLCDDIIFVFIIYPIAMYLYNMTTIQLNKSGNTHWYKRQTLNDSEAQEYEIEKPRFEQTYHFSNPCDPNHETRSSFASQGSHALKTSKIIKSIINYAKNIDDCFYQPDKRYIDRKINQDEMRLD